MPGAGKLVRFWSSRPFASIAPATGGGEVAGGAAPQGNLPRSGGPSVRLVREYVGRLALNAGLPGALGVVLLAAAVLGGYVARADNDRRAAALAEEQGRIARSASAPAPGDDGRTRVMEFFARFPPVGALPDSLRRLNEHAAAHDIDVQRTDYRSTVVSGTPLTLVSLAIPVQADAEALYVWLGALLREMPEIALESVSLKRETSDAATVEADIRLQLYLRGRS